MSLIKATELNFSEGKTISLKSTLIKSAIKRLRDRGMTLDEEHERVIELPDLILEMYEIAKMSDKRNGNVNAKKEVSNE